jgi:hypothetical protein
MPTVWRDPDALAVHGQRAVPAVRVLLQESVYLTTVR